MRLTLNDAWGLLLHSRISPRKKKKKISPSCAQGTREDGGGSTLWRINSGSASALSALLFTLVQRGSLWIKTKLRQVKLDLFPKSRGRISRQLEVLAEGAELKKAWHWQPKGQQRGPSNQTVGQPVPVCDTGHIPAWWEAPGLERKEQDPARLLVERNPHHRHTAKKPSISAPGSKETPRIFSNTNWEREFVKKTTSTWPHQHPPQ